ncbi:MAG: hypothetical protein UIG59_07400 [Acutalibacteraceae bacterium]|nr:hypothetical protein [Acutalibacteraceae bacterium]
MKIDVQDVKIFFKTVAVTATVILCFAAGYFSICTAYEEMRKTMFDDKRSAVIIGDGYLKFFDLEYHSE